MSTVPSVLGAAAAFLRRAPLARMGLFIVVLFALFVPFQAVMYFVAVRKTLPPVFLLSTVVFACVVIAVYRLLVRAIEARSPAELSTAGLGVDTLLGVACGAGLFTAVILLLAAAGVAQFVGINGAGGLWGSTLLAIASAVFEEVLFRGVIYRMSEERFGTTVAIVIAAVLFGLAHASNPGAGIMGPVVITLSSGLLLPFAYTATRTLWLPIGLHFGWNVTESGVFDTLVSGFDEHGLIKTTLAGPRVLTGGAFGPEASVIAVALCLATAAGFAILTRRRGEWRAAPIRAPAPDRSGSSPARSP